MRRILTRGGFPLHGEVTVSGSKNATLPILAASLLIPGETILERVPKLLDVITMIRVLRAMGVRAEYADKGSVRVSVNHFMRHVAPYELVTKMRASFFIIGPLLARTGLAKVPLPGGCAIGARPVDIHLKGLRALGAEIEMEHGFVVARAKNLKGASIQLDFPSVGATETIMMAAVAAAGQTEIHGAAREPEIVDLAMFLIAAGAHIVGAGTDVISIEGQATLRSTRHTVIPDRIEAGTLLMAVAATGGELVLHGVVPSHVHAIIAKLEEAGAEIVQGDNFIRLVRVGELRAVNAKTLPFPGFPTDMQPLLTATMTTAEGTSVIEETIFENRFMHVQELRRMGAQINLDGHTVVVHGQKQLSGAPVRATDLRAGAAMIVAGLVAEGETTIFDAERFIVRGYDNLPGKLAQLGAQVNIPTHEVLDAAIYV